MNNKRIGLYLEIPEELRKQFKILCILQGVSMSESVLACIRREVLKQQNKQQKGETNEQTKHSNDGLLD
ncbi:MAG TPA: hypothetical protein PKN68_03790 [Verrucomicrobiota bacterium]|nr:hypothetical protein [Verrucomicrobiota bacterium]